MTTDETRNDETTTNTDELPEGLQDELEEATEETRRRAWDSVKVPGWAGDDLQDDLR